MSYIEHEVKILGIDIDLLVSRLRELGAWEVFNADRIVAHFDTVEGTLQDRNLKLTEEGKLKLSVSAVLGEEKETVKLFVSRKEECVDLLNRIGIIPITESKSHRISFEWEGIDFDIDQFPGIPAFLEIDPGDSKQNLEDILKKLGLEHHEKVVLRTPEIYERYGLDYFKVFKIR